MMRLSSRNPVGRAVVRSADRRGMAIIITLILTVALGALALSAVYLASSTKIGSGLSNRAADLAYAADAALQMGKSYINADPDAMPETGYREITFNGGVLKDAAGAAIPGVTVKVWAGPTGATSGQFGAYGSIIAQATDQTGAKVVRRLELAQENFARFAYWSNRENNAGTPIWFGGGDVIFGPTWSNDTIRIQAKGARPFSAQFRDDFGTAKIVIQPGEADFWKGFSQNMAPIAMPAPAALADLAAYATSGSMNFNAPNSGDETQVRMRIEFVNLDINSDGSNTDPQDGFIRVYTLNGPASPQFLRADEGVVGDATYRRKLCGEWIDLGAPFGERFFTVESHAATLGMWNWVNLRLTGPVATSLNFTNGGAAPSASRTKSILSRTGSIQPTNRSQCFPAGAPELNMGAAIPYGGTPTTFQAIDANGAWQLYGGVIDPRVTALRPLEAPYLIPLHRSVNPGARGVIHVTGTVAISGLLVGRVTLRTTGNTVILDDIRYGTNPATTGRCVDVLGILSEANVVVADNMLNNQVNSDFSGTASADRRILDDSKDLTLHSVIMAMNTSFRVQNHNAGPTTGNVCNGQNWGRGCLLLLGGLIQEARGPVGTSGGTGYIKQYTYDRCANLRPPPYFPTTGRYLDNRYLEVDPVTFDIGTTMSRLTPLP
jgi:hypothetical protein